MKRSTKAIGLSILSAFILSACDDVAGVQQNKTVKGAATGAGAGALAGLILGDSRGDVAVGAAGGAVIGGILANQ